MVKKWWLKYTAIIEARLSLHEQHHKKDLLFWQNQLFVNFLIYCLPVSLIALLPGVIVAMINGYYVTATVDILSFLLIVFVTFFKPLTPGTRKVYVIGIFYFLSVYLINALGYMGPGVFYLFFTTVLIALILPIRYAYWSVLLNTALLLGFALIIKFGLFNSALIPNYSVGRWIAFSSNLIFASIVIISLIHRIFEKLQITITNKGHLQERYKSIFNNSPLPMWIFDADTLKFLDVNEAASKRYGYTKEEFLLMTIKDINSPEKAAEVEMIVKANNKSGHNYEGTTQHIKKNGDYIYVSIQSNHLYLDNHPVRLVQATDITQQVKYQLEVLATNKKIKESEANLRAVFDSAIDGFVLLDTQHNIKLFNSRATASMRFNKDQRELEIGRCIFEFVEIPQLVYFERLIEKVYAGEVIDYDRKYRTDKGTTNWIRYTLTPVYESHVINGVFITGRDITASKLYLKTVEDQNKIFREISWAQSHLVRAPLARIMGLVPMLGVANGKAEQREILKFITISADELDAIIREISQKSNDIIDKHPVPVNS
ncbi:PAS domain-containing sensor histidine kinase [Mucilaginibacter sp.]|uniref:PAS domain-containing protein n=1 Tax=Mucilaginibacter sp. TaxID=1882438 RepID=UPI0026144CAF|nr:PAS domain-containing sensor histidine kinase [Mucilaginibacter sp.]